MKIRDERIPGGWLIGNPNCAATPKFRYFEKHRKKIVETLLVAGCQEEIISTEFWEIEFSVAHYILNEVLSRTSYGEAFANARAIIAAYNKLCDALSDEHSHRAVVELLASHDRMTGQAIYDEESGEQQVYKTNELWPLIDTIRKGKADIDRAFDGLRKPTRGDKSTRNHLIDDLRRLWVSWTGKPAFKTAQRPKLKITDRRSMGSKPIPTQFGRFVHACVVPVGIDVGLTGNGAIRLESLAAHFKQGRKKSA